MKIITSKRRAKIIKARGDLIFKCRLSRGWIWFKGDDTRTGHRWHREEDVMVKYLFGSRPVNEIARHHRRTTGAILARLVVLKSLWFNANLRAYMHPGRRGKVFMMLRDVYKMEKANGKA